MKTLILTITLLFSLLAANSAFSESKADRPCLVPWPQKITFGCGVLVAPKGISIGVANDSPAAVQDVAETLAADLNELGFSPSKGAKSQLRIVLGLSQAKSLGNEGYRLAVDRDIRITASNETGLFWGTRTLLQLLAKGPGQAVPYLQITDKPLVGFRGLMIDTARQFHSIAFHRQMVKRLASYKLNVYHIHFNDDQSYTLPSEKYSNLPTPGRHYTKQQLNDLVKLAAQYHVTIIPEIEMPCHDTAICTGLPQLLCKGKTEGRTVCAGSNRSFEVLKNLISETMEIFPGPYFHIGGDEVDCNVWSGCPDCEARKRAEGLTSNESLYNWFINRCNRFVRSKGRRTVLWNYASPTVRPEIDKNVLIDEWNLAFSTPGDMLAAGYELVNAHCEPLYVFKTAAAYTPQQLAEWNVWTFGFANIPPPDDRPVMKPGKQLKGVKMCSWENVEQSENAILFGIGDSVKGFASPAPRLPVVAERAWTGNSTTVEDLVGRVERLR
jgi:hexosaminidase